MKGLALEVIVGLVIAIAGVILFFHLLDYFKGASNWFYCNVYLKIYSFFVGGKVVIPEICKYYISAPVKIEEIKERDNKLFSRKLLAYIIACWKEAEIKGLYETHPCYELHLLENVDNVNEWNISEILNKEDHCTSIENSDYGCGVKNQIIWDVDGNLSASLTTANVSDGINKATIPGPIPVDENMFTLGSITRKIQLKYKLSSTIPEQICNYLSPNCFNWWNDTSMDTVILNISSMNYTYSIDLVLSYLEKSSLINSTINNQKILLIEYNGPKDAIEVIG